MLYWNLLHPFFSPTPASRRPMHAVCRRLLSGQLYRVLIGGCDPMLCSRLQIRRKAWGVPSEDCTQGPRQAQQLGKDQR